MSLRREGRREVGKEGEKGEGGRERKREKRCVVPNNTHTVSSFVSFLGTEVPKV